jgi:hypothetical protein
MRVPTVSDSAAQDLAPVLKYAARFDAGFHLQARGLCLRVLVRFGARLGFIHDRFSECDQRFVNVAVSDLAARDFAPVASERAGFDAGSHLQALGLRLRGLVLFGGCLWFIHDRFSRRDQRFAIVAVSDLAAQDLAPV